MWIFLDAIALLFAVLGLIFIRGHGAFLIAGYNTMSQEDQKKINVKALCRFMGKLMFALGGCFVIMSLSDAVDSFLPMWIGMAIFFGVVAFAVIYSNTGHRFSK